MTSTKFRVGTRGSLLALTQTRIFTAALLKLHPDLQIEEVLIQTEGDVTTTPLSESKTPGVFVGALRNALLNHEVDFIIHSMKDLPANPHAEISTACIPMREDSRDGLVSLNNLTLQQLPAGAIIGTSSPRRAASIRRTRPDLEVRDIRGNIDTRIEKVRRGDYDATLLAMAGLNRIDKANVVCEIFDNQDFVPAAGQGALAIECRAEDAELIALLGELDDKHTRLTTAAERAVLSGLNAGCATAIGATAKFTDGALVLVAELAVEQDGETQRVELGAPVDLGDFAKARSLGLKAAEILLAADIVKRVAWK